MSIKARRLVSSMTPEAKAKARQLETEGKDPITGRKPGAKAARCPSCEVKRPPNPGNQGKSPVPPENKGGAA
jgi:hypothetical protein